MAVVDEEARERYTKRLNEKRKEASSFGQQADQHIDKFLLDRFDRLVSVKRFVFLWVGFFVLLFFITFLQFRGLARFYQPLSPVPGGLYSEGIIGKFTNANPIYVSGTVNTAVSHLIFSGLFKYDKNNQLAGDLAKDYSLDKTETRYTVNLRDNITWHDGKPFTADDVVFTYNTIQSTEAQSSLYSSWQDIEVRKIDDHKVVFILPNALSSFPYALTNGILPKHKLNLIPAEELRSDQFNTNPIGTGPFKWKFVEVTGKVADDRQQHITMAAFDKYWDGRPKLDGFSVRTFTNENQMLSAFKHKQINAMSGLETLPQEFNKDASIESYYTPLTGAVMAFFNMSKDVTSNLAVRQALVQSVDISELSAQTPLPIKKVDSPLLHNQLGYNPKYKQFPYDIEKAKQLLDKDGWLLQPDGLRHKGDKVLEIGLSTQDTSQYSIAAKFLQEEWAKLGVKVNVQYFNGEELHGNVISNHDYDVILYGISIGADPDVFAYWDSSQASITSQGHLNLSEFRSKVADLSLQGGRTRSDPKLRVIKYKDFLKTWREAAPALAMYQPDYLYVSRGPVFNYERKAINTAADRYYDVNDWMIRQKRQTVK